MPVYRFTLIIPTQQMTHEAILDATDTLGAADSLQGAISSAISDVERTEFRVAKVELNRETIPV